MTSAGWFDGDEPRSDDEARFLASLRGLAADWHVPDLTPEASGCTAVITPLVVTVRHPVLAGWSGLTEVHVGYWPPPTSLRLEGEWGDDHLLDNGGDQTDLRVQGVAAEPECFAAAAAAWLEAQLLRPLERRDWTSGDKVVATRIRLAGGGQTLVRRGPWWLTRRDPQRTVILN